MRLSLTLLVIQTKDTSQVLKTQARGGYEQGKISIFAESMP